jgi:hypothetical protein
MDSKHETNFNKFSFLKCLFSPVFSKKGFIHTSLQSYKANVITKGVKEFFKNLDATSTVLFAKSDMT